MTSKTSNLQWDCQLHVTIMKQKLSDLSALRWLANIKFIPASWILKTSLDLMKTKRKKGFKKNLNDWIFQKIAFSNQPLHRIKFLMDFNWIRYTFVARRCPPFMASVTYVEITYSSFMHIHIYMAANYCCKIVEKKRIRTTILGQA